MNLNNIHSDNRGSIDALVGDCLKECPEIAILYTKAGYARGGCLHEFSQEYLTVLEGKIDYYYAVYEPKEVEGFERKEYVVTLNKGQSIVIDPNTPHYFISLKDSVVAEWGPTIEEKQGRDEKYRNIVLAINKAKDQNANTTI